MSFMSKVSYSGLNAQTIHMIKDIQKAEAAVSMHYDSLGGETERISHWNIDNDGNVSHYAYIRREDKLNEKLREEAYENAKKLIEKNREEAGVSYEKTISDSVTTGLEFIQGMEKQLAGTKFFVGTVSYGQTYGNSSDTNFVVNPKFLEKLGTDEATRKQFEEDVQYLNDFSKQFREQQFMVGREIISQGWFCDENGNWGGWSASRPINNHSVLQDMTDYAEKIRQEKLEEQKKIEQELKEHFGERFKGFRVEWLDEKITLEEATEPEETENVTEEESVTVSTKIGVNVGKTARKIAAAKTKDQLRSVIAEIKSDMHEVEAGIENGWCDESEMEKVMSLMDMAQKRMGEVEDREATPEEESMFALASLM